MYLAEQADKRAPATVRAYAMMLERFILWWAQYAPNATLATFRREDVLAYRRFMKKPPSSWCVADSRGGAAKAGSKRDKARRAPANQPRRLADGQPNPHYRPFLAGLSHREIYRNERLLARFLDYCVRARHTELNPYRMLDEPAPKKPREQRTTRFFDQRLWPLLWECLDGFEAEVAAIEPTTARQAQRKRRLEATLLRRRWVMRCFYLTALRVHEVVHNPAGNLFSKIASDGSQYWWFRVYGKGASEDDIPVGQGFLNGLHAYRQALAITPYHPPWGDRSPLVYDLSGTRGIGERQLFNVVRDHALAVAERLEAWGQPDDAGKMRAASTHWFRHTRSTHLVDQGVDRRYVRDLTRHRFDATLDVYQHTEDERSHTAVTQAAEDYLPEPGSHQ